MLEPVKNYENCGKKQIFFVVSKNIKNTAKIKTINTIFLEY